MCGLRQGCPSSGYLFALSCDCVFASLSALTGVIFVKFSCDDFQCLVRGIRALQKVLEIIKDFEAASGLAIH